MLNKKQIEMLENLLDDRFEIALITDKRMRNENGNDFLPNNPDFIYYKGILEACTTLGLTYERKIANGKAKHLLF